MATSEDLSLRDDTRSSDVYTFDTRTDAERSCRILQDAALAKWVRPTPSPKVNSPWVERALTAKLPASDRTGSLKVMATRW